MQCLFSGFTAQDYAINKGYSDLAALLVTATMERIDEDTETDTSPQHLDKQKSVSSGSLVPATGSNVVRLSPMKKSNIFFKIH